MKSNKIFSIVQQKRIKWILLFLILGTCIFLIWPASVFETSIFIPVKPENIPNGMTLSPPFPKGIEVQLSGPKSTIKNLKDRSLQYTLDLTGADIGSLTIPINNDFISFPPDINIKKINPSFLTVTIEEESMKIVPVKAKLLSKPAVGYSISKITVIPTSITLKGPKSLLDPIKKVLTKPIEIDGAFESFKKETTIELADGIQNTNPSETIRVEITIKEKIVARSFQDVPVIGFNASYKYHISPNTFKIKVKGPVNTLDKLDANKSIKAHIDLKELKPGIYMKPATILLPVDISLMQVEPEIFTVKISNETASSE